MRQSERSVQSGRIPPSQRSNQDRERRERPPHRGPSNRDHEDYRPDRARRDRRPHASNGRSSSQGPPRSQYSRPATAPPRTSSQHYSPHSHRNYAEKQTFSEKCNNLCSRRGLLQLVEIFLNLLVLVCASATQSASAGFSSIGGFGSSYYYSMGYSMSGFQGDEVNQITQLDVQYNRMKLPTVYCAAGIGLLLLTLTLSFLAAHCMSSVVQNRKLLLAEEVLNVVSAVTYIISIGIYIHFIKQINGTEMCKQREALYSRHGFNSVNCDILGTEVAVCVFAMMLVVLYIASAVVVGLMLKKTTSERNTLEAPIAESVQTGAVFPEETPMETERC
ncbi:MARVEL domain-containing protein 3-like isoform X2 [Ascaphus truei]|uniref:MARVEL domain-containing protein 3-like isoform X2 n=1 Tax=Ascaphus truei TaxID=8439 RepID=UPI003F59426C